MESECEQRTGGDKMKEGTLGHWEHRPMSATADGVEHADNMLSPVSTVMM
jgi:hypothetical protein